MRKILTIISIVLLPVLAGAQGIDIRIESRVSASEKGFSAERLSVAVNGSINEKISYAVFHNLNKPISTLEPFSATDWAYVLYRATDWLSLRGGKFPIAYGSWEYDAAPIDIYYYSQNLMVGKFFQPGVEAWIHFGESDRLELQFTRSMLSADGDMSTVAFSTSWRGHHGFFHPIYSLNFNEMENHAGWRTDIALGNRFLFGRWKIELDLVDRLFTGSGLRPFDSWGVCLNTVFNAGEKWDVFVKGNYDINPGVHEHHCLCAGVEYFPKKGSRDIRLHALVRTGRLDDVFGGNVDTFTTGSVGIKWNVHIFRK